MAADEVVSKAVLSRKVVGVPVLYIGGLFVVILAVVAWRMKNASDSGSPAATDVSEQTDTTGPDAAGDLGNSVPVFTANPNPNAAGYSAGDGSVTVDDNEKWAQRAITWLYTDNHATPGDASAAIGAYLDGAQLSYDQGQLRDLAIRQFGPPPTLPTNGGTAEQPGRKQGNPPLTHTVKGSNDNTIAKLVMLYNGSVNVDYLHQIQSDNLRLDPNGTYGVGTSVVIPAYHTPMYYKAMTDTNIADIAHKNGESYYNIQRLNPGITYVVHKGQNVRIH